MSAGLAALATQAAAKMVGGRGFVSSNTKRILTKAISRMKHSRGVSRVRVLSNFALNLQTDEFSSC